MQGPEKGKGKRDRGRERKVERRIEETKCGIVIEKREHKSMELSADRAEEDKNLWFLWFHQHD